MFALNRYFRNSGTSRCAVGGAEVQKSRLPATRNVYNFWGLGICPFFEKMMKLVLQKCDSVRKIGGISKMQAGNLILVVPPNAIINPKKSMMWVSF